MAAKARRMTLAIGHDAPWNAAWSGESRYEVRPCRWADNRPAVWQSHAPGEGRPLFAEPHAVRQRQSVAKMLCTVCGQPTLPGQRYMFGLGQWMPFGTGAFVWATTEAPVHHRCAQLAQDRCPHIRRHGLKPIAFPPSFTVLAQLVGGQMFGLDIPAARPIVGHLKLLLPGDFARTAFGPPKLAVIDHV